MIGPVAEIAVVDTRASFNITSCLISGDLDIESSERLPYDRLVCINSIKARISKKA